MSVETFLAMLMAVSVLTGLFTEAIKNILNEKKKNYSANIVAGITAIVLSVCVGIFYPILFDAVITDKYIVAIIGLTALSWLSSMVGYDKVLQAITQIRKG